MAMFKSKGALKTWVSATLLVTSLTPAFGHSFGGMQLVNNVRVASVFKGAYGAVYVTFTPALLTGCNGNYGGYLTSTWPEAAVGNPQDLDAPKMQLAMLLAAKATNSPMEVRYRLNSSGTGWDKCAIDALWLQ